MSEVLLPRTNTKAITDDKGVNLNAILDQVAYVDTENSEAAVVPLNADTLGGFPADNYASKTYVSNEIAKAQLGGGSGGDIDLSGYATKDDIAALATKEELNAINFPVDSVNGKTGDVQLIASDVGARPSDWLPTLANLEITATAAELNKMDGVTATTAELNYVDGVTSNIQTQLNGKQATITGGVSSVVSSNFNANRALISNGDGKAASSAVTSTELGYLDGVTSNIQTQINNANLGKLVRLWTNSKPTSSFAAQTVSLTLSGYDYVLVCATWDINNPHRTLPCHIAQVGGSYDGGYMGGRNPSNDSFVGRSIDVTTSGITFAGGYKGTTSDNKVCIPFAIFGINI